MKIKRLIILMLFAGTAFLNTTCKKDKKTPSPSSSEVIIAKEVKVINNQTWDKNIISTDSTNYTITFSKDITSTQQFKVGDIIVSAVGEGMLRKVKSVSTVNNEIKVQTDPASLTDCIKQGLIEINQPLTIKQIKRIDYHYPGIKLNTNNFKSSGLEPVNLDINTVLYDLDGNNATTADQIKLIGTLRCDWGFNLRIDVGLSEGLKEVKFGVIGSENLDLQLVTGIQYGFKKEISIATVYFTPIIVTIGVIPVVFTPQLDIILGIDGSANASITSKITQSLSFDNGIRFLKGQGWSPYKTFNKDFSFQPPQLNMNASACAYLMPEFSIKVYMVAGPYANLKIYSRLDADLLQTPWWKLYGGITMDAGAKVDIIDKFTLDYTVSDLIQYEQMLAQSTTPPILKPTISTNDVITFDTSSALLGGNVTSEGGTTVSENGIYYGTSANPETTGTKLQISSGKGSFSKSLTGLTPNTLYYIKAYATNSAGTGFGQQQTFTTLSGVGTGAVTDIDGNVYHAVTIGTQVWMVENLKTTKYRNGDPIPNITDVTSWTNLTTGAYSNYNNNANNSTTYGRLYNWYTVKDNRNIAPLGWHIPTFDEWTTLADYLGGRIVAGGKLKETGTFHWISPNSNATNETGFMALPGGDRGSNGLFENAGGFGFWWSTFESSSTTAIARALNYASSDVFIYDYLKSFGNSIRCLKD